MNKEIELEMKIMLTNSEYLTIASAMCENIPCAIQTNYYFDDENYSMNKKGITCRIRHKNGKYITTIKKHNKDIHDFSVENIVSINNSFNKEYFEQIGLILYGEMVTERMRIFKNDFCEVVLDKNTYLQKTDYELEIEYAQKDEEYANKILIGLAEALLNEEKIECITDFINRKVNPKSKSERFFEEKMLTRRSKVMKKF